MSWMIGIYPWVKALHIISVIAWMAGLFYLPRLFVYHCEVAAGSEEDKRFQLMERRLLRMIMNPSMIASYVFGILLTGTPGAVDWLQGWMYVKLAAVLVLTVLHHALGRWRKDFAAGANRHSDRFFRVMNEVPTLAMIVIVVAVVVKPF